MRLKTKGFTLIELLVVIAIIAILAILIIMALNAARMRARDSARRSDLRSVQTALELYNDTNGQYPAGTTGYDTGLTSLKSLLETGDYGFTGTTGLPDDPTNVTPYLYGYKSGGTPDGTNYALGAMLEGAAGGSDTSCGAGAWEHCVGTDMVLLPVN